MEGKSKRDVGEERTTAASYIITFFQEVGNLTSQFAAYQNLMLELKESYKTDEAMGKMEESDRNQIKLSTQNVRFYALKCYTMYEALIEGAKKSKDQKVKQSYENIKRQFIINTDELEEYVMLMNKVLATEIMQGLLETSQSIMDDIYKDKN
jgi:hypothetical protein